MLFSSDSKLLISGSCDHITKVWSLSDFAEMATLKGHNDEASCLTMTAQGLYLISGSKDGGMKVWSLNTLSEVANCRHRRDSYSKPEAHRQCFQRRHSAHVRLR